jgi:protein-S-isoprenylcysteine O-methyltransferase Ste14
MMPNITYDLLMRLPLSGWATFSVVAQVLGLFQYINIETRVSIGLVFLVHAAMLFSTIVFMSLIAAAVVIRSCPSRKASGLEPRISALLGTFLTYAIVMLFPRRELSISMEMTATFLVLIGNAGAIFALRQLGRSFSVMAETRQLVTSGPYRFVRHPLYLTEGIAIIGVFMQFASVWTALVLVLQIAFQLRRMHNEETVLTVSFPEYAAYSRNSARLIPGLY